MYLILIYRKELAILNHSIIYHLSSVHNGLADSQFRGTLFSHVIVHVIWGGGGGAQWGGGGAINYHVLTILTYNINQLSYINM